MSSSYFTLPPTRTVNTDKGPVTNSHSLCSTSSTRNNVTPFSKYQELLIDIKAPTRRRVRRLRAATRKLSRQILVQFTTRDFIL